MTIPQALTEAARRHAERPALIGHRVALTHAELEGCIGRAAADLEARGVRPGDLVGVSMASSPLHLVTILALARAGACSVHVHPGHPQPVKEALMAQFGVGAVIGEAETLFPLKADPSWLEPGKAPAHPSRATSESAWRISLSSGTTGLQKAVHYGHAAILHYLKLHDQVVPMSPDERYLCHRGLDSNLVLNTCLCHLRAGGAVVFPASLSLAHFIEAIDRNGVTQLAMPPALLRDLIAQIPSPGVRFPALRLVRVAGSSFPLALAEAGLARISANLAVVYGMAELGFVTIGRSDVLREAPGSVGRSTPGVEIQVVDPHDAPVPPGTAGIVRLRRAGMPKEYFRNPEATARSFRGGWFHTSDVGRLGLDGLLYIDGRVDDKINLEGLKVDPAPTERALEEHPAVVEAAVFAAAPDRGPTALFAAAVLRAPVDEKLLIAHCRSRVGAMFTPARIFFVDKLPRNDAGKVLRADLSRRVRRPGT